MANVSVSNTTGLYIGSGAASVLNNAQQLLSLLSNNGGVVFSLDPTTSNTKVEASANGTVANATYAITAGYALTSGTAQFVTGLTSSNVTTALGYVPADSNAAGGYGNSNVASFLPVYTGNVGSGSGYFFGNGAFLTGIAAGSTYSNANVAAFLPTYTGAISSMTGNLTTTANVQGAFLLGNGSQLTGITTNYSNANVAAFLPTYTGAISSMTGNLTTTANVQGAFILGNGSQLTGLAATYSNTNVAAFLPTYTGAMTAMTGNVTTTANVQGAYIKGNGSALTSVAAVTATTAQFVTGLTGANVTTALGYVPLNSNSSAVSAGLATYVTANAQANITSVGTLSSLTVTGNINTASGIFTGNGSGLTGVTAKRLQDISIAESSNISIDPIQGQINFYADEQSPLLPSNFNFTSIATNSGSLNVYTQQRNYGNVYIETPLVVNNTVATTGNITAANLTSNGYISAVATIYAGNIITGGTSGNITGANYINANFFVGNGSLLTGISGGSTYGDSNVAAFLPTYTGAMTSMTGNVITTANVAAAYFIGNGSQLTGISGGGSPGGSSTFIQYNNAGSFDGSANLIYSPTNGNITLGNLVFNKNYNRILQTNPFDTTVQSSTQNATGQFIVGDGWNGNVTSPSFNNGQFIDGSFALINKAYVKTDNGRRSSTLGVQSFVNVTANMTNGGSRIGTLAVQQRIGGNTTQTATNAFSIVGINNAVAVGGGNGTFATLGNANLRVVTGTTSAVAPQIGSFVGNAIGYLSNLEGTANGQFLDRMINYSILSPGAYTTPGAFYGYHMPNAISVAGTSINNAVRQAPQYYFLYNEDDVAQVRLGSLRRYNEYRANITSSSGSLTVDKNTAQVQYLTPTEAVTSVTFSNFVTSANNGANNITQTDTVTLIVQQAATPYDITMPSGPEYKYAAGKTTVGNTASTVTMVSITATQNVSGGTNLYLITISPEFV